MHGLPEKFDGADFVGTTLEVISFASNIVIFDFGAEVSVSVVGGYSFSLNSTGEIFEEKVPVSRSGVITLIGRDVETVEIRRPGDFALVLGEGTRLTFRDDSEMYEAYSIKTKDGEIFV
jgi:hypothetical protein